MRKKVLNAIHIMVLLLVCSILVFGVAVQSEPIMGIGLAGAMMYYVINMIIKEGNN